ncbi:unnamed protein product [Polarella glacialis]|uniref:Uncharacterized protein n=1 Tax=Polarella glacialis TaxID=89957 RepID=A0A813H9M2_POLGL|nr:unnamed protein product [Polarella glacialis]
MKNASKLLVKQAIITFFFWKPQRWMVQAFCLFGILLYPVVFLGLMVYLTYSLTHIVAKGKKSLDESGKEVKADYDPGLVYNKDKGQWLDPKCREIRVVLDPKIPPIIPVIPGLMTNHVRCCIPILTADGEILSFAPETKASDKGPLGSPRGSPDFSKASDKKVSRDYLGRSVEKEKDEELRKEGVLEKLDVAENDKRKGLLMKVETDLESEMEKVQVDPLTLEVSKQKLIEQLTKEKQLAEGIRMRAEKHTVKLEKEIKVLSTEASGGALAEHFPPYFEEVENLNVAEKIKGFKPVKCREDCEQLDEEEQFAMRQFLETLIRKEERLLRYNILAVNMKDGFLKPREPVTQQGGAPEKWWCDEAEDDANLDNFTFNHNYIETSSGDRLVYTGHSRSMLSWFKVGTEVAGDVQWMAEPEDGWDDWLDKQQKDKLSSQKYADKWQWIYLDQPSLPWNGDEEHEKSVYFCGYPLFQKTTIPLYKEFRSLITSQFREKVPATITAAEKNEIRKWMWKQLLPYTELKLKLGWVAGLNSKFKNQSVQELVQKPFSKVYSEIGTADRRQAPGLFESENLQEDELLSWTIMKLEDLYPDGAEPWWNECDKPADSEQRVMFDHESFWMTGAEPDLKKRRKENPLIPEHGYFTSSVFSNFPDDSFGIKRYVLKKPDGSHTRVDLHIQVKHVMPLMRYTSSFKVNVPVDNLELPNATTLRIVLGASKKGEEYNYCVDRATTLISIGVLASNPSGPVSATVFLAVKTLTFLNRWYVSYKSDEYEEEGEEGEEAEEDAPAETGEEANFLGTTTEGSRPDQKTLWQAFREVDISVLFLQCCTLALLAVGQYGGMPAPLCAVACIVVCSTTMLYMNLATFQKEMEKNLQRFANTMVTGYKTAQQVSWRAQEWLNGENRFGIQFVKFESQVADKSSAATEINFIVPELGLVLSGKPKVDESLPLDEKKRQQMTKQVAYYIHKPTNVSDKRPKSVRDNSRFEFDISNGFCVALDIAQLKLCKPIPQIRATIQCVNHNESRICRQEFDSFITLYFPGDWDGEEEPSFATPEGKKKIEELLSTWKMQVDSWMEGTLGAVTTARTLTSKIQHHIESLLKAPYIGSTIRNVVKMKIAHILLPNMAKSTCLLTLLEDRMVYATCIYDSESPLSAVPKGRMSLFGRLKKFAQLESSKASLESFEDKLRNDADDDVDETLSKLKPESIEWMVQMDDYFDIPLPAAVNKVRLMFWVQDFEGKTEDLLGFTDEFDLRGMVRQQDDEEEDGENPSAAPGFFQAKSTKDLEDEERLWLHTRWTANSRANTLEPEKADEIISAEDITRWQSLKQWVASFYSVPVTKEDLQMSKGYVDIVVKGSLKHELEMDVMDMLAVKDLVAGKSNMNQKKLERHTDRFFTFAKIFGVSVDRASITCVTGHIETMKNILQKEVSHEITADDGIRRSLQKRDGLTLNPNWKADVQAVISSLEKQVVEQETFLKANEMVVPGHKLEMRRIGTRITVPAHKTFQDTLEARLKEFQLAETLSSKNILHYVMLSEHVKPSKLWRPDAICPHVCSIVTAEFDDVTDVRLTGGAQSLEIAFKRQQHANAPDVPVMVHGRMGFKAEGLEGAEALWQGQKELWLYWDGASRWIVSPFKGESAPYGPGQGQAPEHFMWVQDPANSPEKVNQSWMVWKENVNHPKGGLWQQDLSIRILSNFIGKKQETRADVLLAQVEDDDLGVKGGLMDEILKSMRYLLVPSKSSKATPELKDCLLSLEGNNIGFAWKDFALEELAPFRKFLLGEFSTYQGIWLHLTRNSKIKRTLLQRNLTKMLAESRVELAVAEKQEQEELARDAYRLEQEANARHLVWPNHMIQSTNHNKQQQNNNNTTSTSQQTVIWRTLRHNRR